MSAAVQLVHAEARIGALGLQAWICCGNMGRGEVSKRPVRAQYANDTCPLMASCKPRDASYHQHKVQEAILSPFF